MFMRVKAHYVRGSSMLKVATLALALFVWGAPTVKAAPTFPSVEQVASDSNNLGARSLQREASFHEKTMVKQASYSSNEADDISGFYFLAMMLLGLLCIAVYFLPTIISLSRHHEYRTVIVVTNIFCAWTGLVWLGLLAWSVWPRRSFSPFPSSEEYKGFNPQRPSYGPPPFPAASAVRSNSLSGEQIESLEKIGRLKQEGVLTDEEFNDAKKKILNAS